MFSRSFLALCLALYVPKYSYGLRLKSTSTLQKIKSSISKSTLNSECSVFDAPPTTGRVWTICEGNQFEAPSKEQQLAGVKSSNAMKCTKEMSFKQLCCFDYAGVEQHLNRLGGVTLDLAQVEDSVEEVGSDTTALNFINDAKKNGTNAKQLTLCSMQSPTPEGDETATEVKVDCVAHEFTVDEVKANRTSQQGNVILNARIEFLKAQGLPLSSIPVCSEEVTECPCGTGPKKPATAGQKYLEERAKGTSVEVKDNEGSEGVMLLKKNTGRLESAFSGAMMTSGSFTSMASNTY